MLLVVGFLLNIVPGSAELVPGSARKSRCVRMAHAEGPYEKNIVTLLGGPLARYPSRCQAFGSLANHLGWPSATQKDQIAKSIA